MATWEDVRERALALPETEETTRWGTAAWQVRSKTFVWERPLRKSDHKALGDAAPQGEILGAQVEHLVAKEALLADPSGVYFTTPHFDGYAMILVELDSIALPDLDELIVEAWLCKAPKRVAEKFTGQGH